MKKLLITLTLILTLCLTAFSLTACKSPNDCKHENKDERTVLEATCTQVGLKRKTCVDCGKILEEQTIAKLYHTASDWVINEATCTQVGLKRKTCVDCGKILEEETIAKLSHTESDWVINEATCTQVGLKRKTCVDCGKILEEETIAKLSHTASDWVINEATCTQVGLKRKTCVDCGKILEEETIAKLSHTASDWIIDEDASCKDAGIRHKKCISCNAILEIDKVSDSYTHNYIYGECELCGAIDSTYMTDGLVYMSINNDTEYSVVGYTGSETNVIIPAVYRGKAVTSIANTAFESGEGVLPLTSIEIPDSITSIGYIGHYSSLKYNIKDGIKYLGNSNNPYIYLAGVEDNSITTATIDNGCKFIGTSAFYERDFFSSIGYYAFRGCYNLTSVTFGENSQLTSIGDNAFEYCGSLTSIEIPASVTSIGEQAFDDCYNLTSVTFRENSQLTSIGSSAFYNCYRLVEVINKSEHITVTKGSSDNGDLGYYALSVSNREDNYVSKLSTDANGFVIYTEGEEKILVNYIGSRTDITIPNGITKINNHAFYSCDNLTSVTFRENSQLTSIGKSAFYWCDSLTSIEIPASVTSIGDYAFYYCRTLTSIEIPASVTSIGDYAFYNCSSLETIEIPNSVTSIGDYAFYNCESLTSIVIPSSVTSIGSYAFYNYLASITIYCEAESKPSGWDSDWYRECKVVWGYKGEN